MSKRIKTNNPFLTDKFNEVKAIQQSNDTLTIADNNGDITSDNFVSLLEMR